MSKQIKKSRRGGTLIAFVLGIIIGRSAVRPLTHIFYIVMMIIVYLLAQDYPLNMLWQ